MSQLMTADIAQSEKTSSKHPTEVKRAPGNTGSEQRSSGPQQQQEEGIYHGGRLRSVCAAETPPGLRGKHSDNTRSSQHEQATARGSTNDKCTQAGSGCACTQARSSSTRREHANMRRRRPKPGPEHSRGSSHPRVLVARTEARIERDVERTGARQLRRKNNTPDRSRWFSSETRSERKRPEENEARATRTTMKGSSQPAPA